MAAEGGSSASHRVTSQLYPTLSGQVPLARALGQNQWNPCAITASMAAKPLAAIERAISSSTAARASIEAG